MQPSLFPSQNQDRAGARGAFRAGDLNRAQLEAATCMGAPVLVIAGAGTGKTRTLVYRMAYLIEQGVAADNILLLTFTRKAAQEMIERAGRLINDPGRKVTGGTFHAMANILLRRYGHHLGYAPNFTILDRSDSEGIINLIKSSLELGGSGKRFPSKRVVCNLLSRSVNKCTDIETVIADQYSHLEEYRSELERIFADFRKFKLEHGLMDYDDLLVNLRRVMTEVPRVREEIAERFNHVLVDEYQDTNPIQADIVRLVAAGHNNVMVVGDDSQSIYSFRGADFRNIMDFPKVFPGTRVVRLEENYRSTQAILALTNAIIDKAEEKYSKKLFSNIDGGAKPRLQGTLDEAAQARRVAEQIVELRGRDVPADEIAVLFRSGFHSYKLELELTNRQVQFEKRGGLKLTESAHIKDVLAYLRVTGNPGDHLSWNRILLLLDKVGPKTARNVLDRIRANEDPLEAIRAFPAGKSWRAGLDKLVELLLKLRAPGLEPVAIFDMVMEYYREIFERIYHDDYPTRSRDLDQLRQLISGYGDLQSLLDDTTLDPPETTDESLGGRLGSPPAQVILSTIHSAKGLEWDHVFVINLAAGRFPSCQPFMTAEWEEERRMFYVAATRARKMLYLSYPREVMSFDRQSRAGGMSPFLAELSPALLDSGPGGGTTMARSKLSPPARQGGAGRGGAPDINLLTEGVTVRHPFFGEGRIEKTSGKRSVEVFFPRHGRKTLHLDYAKLEIIG
ncbi:MAG: ATP-dependent helicase [Desulfurivibrionaceae bacterium]|nr:ATP-dependent helicase [Desulfobulbales bacterium]MDT8334250.1 ATP-dependent helicase [Desulfurivibrionaceae bacterium]